MEKIKIDNVAAFLYPMPWSWQGLLWMAKQISWLKVGFQESISSPLCFAIALEPHHNEQCVNGIRFVPMAMDVHQSGSS